MKAICFNCNKTPVAFEGAKLCAGCWECERHIDDYVLGPDGRAKVKDALCRAIVEPVNGMVSVFRLRVGSRIRDIEKDSPEMKELMESVRVEGVKNPLILRGRTVIDGARRLYAARQVGRKMVPCRQVKMGDIEIQQSMQRVPINPMEYARSLHHILNSSEITISKLAREIEKSEKWIEQRLSLLNLIPPAQRCVDNGELSLGNAVLLTTSSDQERDLPHAVEKTYMGFLRHLQERR